MTSPAAIDPHPSDLAVVYRQDKSTFFVDEHFTLTPTGLKVKGRPPIESFARVGKLIKAADSATKLWVGDWMRIGEQIHGEDFAQVLSELGWPESTSRQMIWVSEKVAPTVRRKDLDWTHHRAVAALDPESQKLWLARAADGDGSGVPWAANELGRRIRAEKVRKQHVLPSETAASDSETTTPDTSARAGDSGLEDAPSVEPGVAYVPGSALYATIYVDPDWRVVGSDFGVGRDDVARWAIPSYLMSPQSGVIALRVPATRVEDGLAILHGWGGYVRVTLTVGAKAERQYGARWGGLTRDLVLIATVGAFEPAVDYPLWLENDVKDVRGVQQWLQHIPLGPLAQVVKGEVVAWVE